MKPNELADSLAGCFAPLAFLWLVLGFFQQGDELRNSVAALRLQGEELRNSVEQQRELVHVTREQLGLELANQRATAAKVMLEAAPSFHISGGFAGWCSPTISSKFVVRNLGAPCRRLRLYDDDGIEVSRPLFSSDHKIELEYQSVAGSTSSLKNINVECFDSLGNKLCFHTQILPTEGQYGLEFSVSSADGLFAFVKHLDVAIERDEAPPLGPA